MMSPSDIIDRTPNHVTTILSGDGTGHDWWHVYRVWRTAQRIGQAEKADLLVVELAALLHDIADWKLHAGDSMLGPKIARDRLDSLGLSPPDRGRVGIRLPRRRLDQPLLRT
jgi:uncharacterized protein